MASKTRHPICITSPLRRSGTTLLQRLLCSSPDALIYGESCANDFNLLANLFSNKEMLFLQNKEARNHQLQEVLNGNVNDWIPDLMPEIDGYIDAYKNMINTLAKHYNDYAQGQGRKFWGMKMPEWMPTGLILLQKILPETKIIYLRRDLEDCVKSAKKMDMIREPQEIQQFCHTWKQFTSFADLHLKGDQVLHVNYEDLIHTPDQIISTIETFTGVQGIDRKVMEVKVNTYNNDPKLEEMHSYLEPAVLTAEELAIVAAFSNTSQTV